MPTSRPTLVITAAILLGACGTDPAPAEITEGFGLRVDESAISGEIEGQTLQTTFSLVPLAERSIDGRLVVRLQWIDDLEADPLAVGATDFSAGDGRPVHPRIALPLPEIAEVTNLARMVLSYRVILPEGELFGFRSAFDLLALQSFQIAGDDRFTVGRESLLRIAALDVDSGKPLPETPVVVSFEDDDGTTRQLTSGRTDARGELLARLSFDEADLGPGHLLVSGPGHLSRHPVLVERPQRILVTLDKPLYQPGQQVHVRALVMRQPEVTPLAAATLQITVEDPKANEIVKRAIETDAHGIAAFSFELADRVNLGEYTLRIGADEASSQVKTFTVARYRLPKFAVELKGGQPYFQPGEPVSGEVVARYYFGQPVADAQVALSVSLQPATPSAYGGLPQEEQLEQIVGRTDAEGRFPFSLTVAQAGELRVDAEVIDATSASARASQRLLVSDGNAVLQVIPEPSTVVQGQQATLYLLLTDPAGKPLAGRVTLSGAVDAVVDVPPSGVATTRGLVASCTPSVQPAPAPGDWEDGPAMERGAMPDDRYAPPGPLRATFDGRTIQLPLPCSAAAGLVLHTDRALYRENDTAQVTIDAPVDFSQVTLEVLRHNAPLLTRTVTLQAGRATVDLPLSGELTRAVTLRAFAGEGDRLLSARRLIFIASADQLAVEIAADRPSYRAGDRARVTLRVSDAQGQGTAAALGVQVVDEAVYGLSPVKPGIERAFFSLSDEVVASQLRFVGPETLLVAQPQEADQLRARMLFAATGDRSSFALAYGDRAGLLTRAQQLSRRRLDQLRQALQQEIEQLDQTEGIWQEIALKTTLSRFVEEPAHHDGFGRRLRYTIDEEHRRAMLSSSGMDELWNSADDLETSVYLPRLHDPGMPVAEARNNWDDQGQGASVAPDPTDPTDPVDPTGPSGAGVRQYFPETLHVDPALITDAQGRAEIDLQLADSITNWKLTAIAHSARGQLGSAVGDLTVFQPFFIDLLLPTQLLQDDEVSVPVAVYNYLDRAQQVQVEVTPEPWFELLDGGSRTVTVGAHQVTSVSFRLRARRVGRFGLSASATGDGESDAIRRTVEVQPDGRLTGFAHSGLLEPGSAVHDVTIPDDAIEGGSELLVKVFPGMTSQVVEGFESMLRQPNGCFEQTSSSTYPNVMVLRYLKGTGQVSPEVEARATAFIATGYQRLLTFEVDGGGFSLWGDAPASQTLTAFALMQFADMAQVRHVDEAMLARARDWLLARQQDSGAFPKADTTAHRTGGQASSSEVLSTAYVAWGLAESGFRGEELTRALDFVRQNASEVTSSYGLALMANALLAVDPADATATQLLGQLEGQAIRSEGTAQWNDPGESMTCGYGNSMQIETTALALNALLAAEQGTPLTGQGVAFLASKRDRLGGFGTTQSTALALRALLAAYRRAAREEISGTVIVSADGEEQARFELGADITRVVDLNQLASGQRRLQVSFAGRGEIGYQVVGNYWVPHRAPTTQGPLQLAVTYDRQQLAVGQTLQARVTVRYDGSGALPSPMVHLGLPPGFTYDAESLNAEGTGGLVRSAEQRGAHLVLYLAKLSGERSFEVPLRAGLPVKGKAPASTAYAYYTPELQTIHRTPEISVYPAN